MTEINPENNYNLGPQEEKYLKNFRFRSGNRGVHSLGTHLASHRGNSIEFQDYEKYQPGNDLRHFDFRIYGRTQKEMVRVYSEEQKKSAILLIDDSTSMSFSFPGKKSFTKSEIAKQFGFFLTQLYQFNGESTGIALFSDKLSALKKPGSSPASYRDLIQLLKNKNNLKNKTDFEATFEQLHSQLTSRHDIFLFSDFYENPAIILKSIQKLKKNSDKFYLFHLIDANEVGVPLSLAHYIDCETGKHIEPDALISEKYLKLFRNHANELEKLCKANLVIYTPLVTSESLFNKFVSFTQKYL